MAAPSHGLSPLAVAGMALRERTIVGHQARAILPEAAAHLAAAVWAELAETIAAVDGRLPGSDVARLRLRGGPERVSPRLYRALEAALAMAAQTGGGYDPTRRAGAGTPAGLWSATRLDSAAHTVHAPGRTVFDLSDLLGALAVEAALGALAARGASAALVQVDGCVGIGDDARGGWAIVGPTGRAERLRGGAMAVAPVPGDARRVAVARAATAPEAAALAQAAARAEGDAVRPSVGVRAAGAGPG